MGDAKPVTSSSGTIILSFSLLLVLMLMYCIDVVHLKCFINMNVIDDTFSFIYMLRHH